MKRRDVLKGLATLPVLGAYAYALYKKKQISQQPTFNFLAEFESRFPLIGDTVEASKPKPSPGNKLRIGFIGFGSRGSSIARSAGFAHPTFIKNLQNDAQSNPNDKRYQTFMIFCLYFSL